MLLRDAGGHLLVVISGDGWVRLHGIQAELERALELAPEQDVERLFGDCDPGAVPCTDTAYGIETIVDKALGTLAHVYSESGDHEHLVRVSGEVSAGGWAACATVVSATRNSTHKHASIAVLRHCRPSTIAPTAAT